MNNRNCFQPTGCPMNSKGINMKKQTTTIETKDALLTISGDGDGRQWQHFLLSFGVHADASHDACVHEWPREAIHRARRMLDEMEKELT